jgi:hypothetical protein
MEDTVFTINPISTRYSYNSIEVNTEHIIVIVKEVQNASSKGISYFATDLCFLHLE